MSEKGTGRPIQREGEGEDVTQTVLGLSARWIWHLEEQRPLTLRCGHAAVMCVYIYMCSPRTYIHTYITRERESVRVLQPFLRSCRQGRSGTPARAHTRRGWIAYNYPLSDTEIYVRIPRAHVTNGRSASKERDLERGKEISTKSKGSPQHAPQTVQITDEQDTGGTCFVNRNPRTYLRT